MNKLTFSLRLNLSLSGFRDKFFIISNNNVVYTYFCCNVSMCNIRVSSEKEKSFYENFAFWTKKNIFAVNFAFSRISFARKKCKIHQTFFKVKKEKLLILMLSSQSREFHKFFNCCSYKIYGFRELFFSRTWKKVYSFLRQSFRSLESLVSL